MPVAVRLCRNVHTHARGLSRPCLEPGHRPWLLAKRHADHRRLEVGAIAGVEGHDHFAGGGRRRQFGSREAEFPLRESVQRVRWLRSEGRCAGTDRRWSGPLVPGDKPSAEIKQTMKFRRSVLRGVAKVRGKWNLVCAAANLMTLHRVGAEPACECVQCLESRVVAQKRR